MAVIRTTLALTAALTLPQAILPPPLETGPAPGGAIYPKRETLSQLAIAGKELYQIRCSGCHGNDAKGSPAGPSLLHPVYRSVTRRDFHRAISEGVPAQRWHFGDMPASPDLSFNDIEFIARYVRELQSPNKLR